MTIEAQSLTIEESALVSHCNSKQTGIIERLSYFMLRFGCDSSKKFRSILISETCAYLLSSANAKKNTLSAITEWLRLCMDATPK